MFDSLVLDIFIEIIWSLAFFINCNRVDPIRKIYRFQDTMKAYLYSPFMIPDAAVIISCVIWTIMKKPDYVKIVQLFRLFHFRKVLYPVNLGIEAIT